VHDLALEEAVAVKVGAAPYEGVLRNAAQEAEHELVERGHADGNRVRRLDVVVDLARVESSGRGV
jgi:hypothetical protein